MTETIINPSYRLATNEDIDHIVNLLIGSLDQVTTQVGMRIFGFQDLKDLRIFVKAMVRSSKSWEFTHLAFLDQPQPVGMLQIDEAPLRLFPWLLIAAVQIYGVSVFKELGHRLPLLDRVQTTPPEDTLNIAELHISPDHRGAGLGKKLLLHAETLAEANGKNKLSLQTWTTNPAVGLYQRFGFEIIESCVDSEFEALTGVPGNHLMVKHL